MPTLTSRRTLVLSRTPDDGVTIFYQSDIKSEGTWINKGYLCQKVAERLGHAALWHKIVCRRPPGQITKKRSAYTHILCFSKGVRLDSELSTADVLPEMGDKTWERGMGFEACRMIAQFIADQTTTKTVAHPFCGQGSMLAMANAFGLAAIGIDRNPHCVELATLLQADLVSRRWQGISKDRECAEI